MLLSEITEDNFKDYNAEDLGLYLEKQALTENKVVGNVVDTTEICERLNSISDIAAVSLLEKTLSDLERMRNGKEFLFLPDTEKITQDYICGRSQPWVLPTTTQEEREIGEDINLCFTLNFKNAFNSELVSRHHLQQAPRQQSHPTSPD